MGPTFEPGRGEASVGSNFFPMGLTFESGRGEAAVQFFVPFGREMMEVLSGTTLMVRYSTYSVYGVELHRLNRISNSSFARTLHPFPRPIRRGRLL